MRKQKKNDLNENDKDDKSDKSDKKKKDIENSELKIEDSNKEKAMFIQRLCAYFIDIIIVSFVATLIAYPFTNNGRVEELNEEANSIMEKYVGNEIDLIEYTVEYANITYDLSKCMGAESLVTIAVGILYYAVFQLYMGGRTLGKMALKIKVVSTTGNDLTMNQMIFRSFIANSLLLNILSMIFIIFSGRETYFYCYGIFSLIQDLIVFISLLTIMYGKNGLAVHDKLVHTKVIRY